MLNAAFFKKFSKMYRDKSEEDLRRPTTSSKHATRPGDRYDTPSQLDYVTEDDAKAGFSQWGNCQKFINRNSSSTPADLLREKPQERRYQKNRGRPSYRRLDSDSGVIGHCDAYRLQSRNQKPKYGPRDIEVWSKKSSKETSPTEDRPGSRELGRSERGGAVSGQDGAELKDWLSWRCFLNHNLARTVLETRGASTSGVRTVCAEPDFGKTVVRRILDEYADRDQKPPTSLHENDYLMFGVPRARLRPEAAAVAAVIAAVTEDTPQPHHFLLQGRPPSESTLHYSPQFFPNRKMAEHVKGSNSRCLPSLRWKTKQKKCKSKAEASSEPDYLPSRYAKIYAYNAASRKVSSDDERVWPYQNHRPYSPWGHVARPRDRMALPPESSFLMRSRSQSSYWSTSSMTLSLTSSSSADYSDGYSSLSDKSSSLYSYTSKPLFRRKLGKKYGRR